MVAIVLLVTSHSVGNTSGPPPIPQPPMPPPPTAAITHAATSHAATAHTATTHAVAFILFCLRLFASVFVQHFIVPTRRRSVLYMRRIREATVLTRNEVHMMAARIPLTQLTIT